MTWAAIFFGCTPEANGAERFVLLPRLRRRPFLEESKINEKGRKEGPSTHPEEDIHIVVIVGDKERRDTQSAWGTQTGGGTCYGRNLAGLSDHSDSNELRVGSLWEESKVRYGLQERDCFPKGL